jgi:hypothetical protein
VTGDPTANAALDWHVAYDCRLKQRFTLAQLAPIVLTEGGPDGLLQRLRTGEPSSPASGAVGVEMGGSTPDQRVVTRTSPTESGLIETLIPPNEAQRRAEAARRFRRTCRDCPANGDAGRQGFGCFGTMRMPIPGEAEEALMLVIVRIMEGGDDVQPGAASPIRHIWDNGLTGRQVNDLRARGGWFERHAPVVARVGPFLEKRDISSDQVFEVFLAAARFPVEYAVLFSAFLAEFPRLAADADPAIAVDAAPLIRFFRSLLLASDLGVNVLLTPLVPDPRADTSEDAGMTNESLPAMELGLMDES